MLSKFGNEVLLHGPDALLPQNLNNEWLDTLQKMAGDFLDASYDLEECKKPEDVADPILSVCISEILRSQHKDKTNISVEKMLENITIYSVSLIIEAVERESNIGIEQPTLENILSWDRIIKMRKTNPKFVEALEKACILMIPEQASS
ncbi:MAG: hypothetical protein JRF31_09705 [Deltaproteobacteria bacterium]|nr:hypothetical protein [Deltaproteobacteria bacterium]MBW2013574.1 hypothetical protein [Deltaproteobacteria bacterium]MBW2089997.1 hypothetical protein [Deltaproteobacteria bacterium]MBW2321097.1 hypothetical protein [Deltaproteobacteria bacterium]OQY11330.1 MAG: hypothetical protein B6I30_07010 [Desulfobacteraceae bacterium 4572_187]